MTSWPQILEPVFKPNDPNVSWLNSVDIFFQKVNPLLAPIFVSNAFQPDLQQHLKGSTHPQSLGSLSWRDGGWGWYLPPKKKHQLITSKLMRWKTPPQGFISDRLIWNKTTWINDLGEKKKYKEMRQAQAGFSQLIASPKRRKIVHLLSEKNSEIQPKQKVWVSDHLASWHCIQAWPNLQKHPSWGKKIHSQLQWLVQWDDIPNNFLQIPNQSNHLQSHRPGNFGANEVGISESKLWEFICLIPQRYSLTRCKQKFCWLQFAPKEISKNAWGA